MSEYVSMSHIIDRKSRFKVRLAYKNVFFYNILISPLFWERSLNAGNCRFSNFATSVTFSLTWPASRRRRHKFFSLFFTRLLSLESDWWREKRLFWTNRATPKQPQITFDTYLKILLIVLPSSIPVTFSSVYPCCARFGARPRFETEVWEQRSKNEWALHTFGAIVSVKCVFLSGWLHNCCQNFNS